MLKPVPYVNAAGPFAEDHRTEDVKFSPSGRVLAVVATDGVLTLFAVDTASGPIQVTRYTELRSTSLAAPHGVDFLSEDSIVVANRSGWLTFYRLPHVSTWADRATIEPIHEMDSPWFGRKGQTRNFEGRDVLCGPGSVRVHGHHLFVCCNYSSSVTSYPYRLEGGRVETGEGTLVAQVGSGIPDGVAVSPDGRWIAVSSHHTNSVALYRMADKQECGVLRDPGLSFPHGLCFDRFGQGVYAADAGERQLHVFVNHGDWERSMDRSTFTLAAVDLDAFDKTRGITPDEHKQLEGGAKGIDVDPSGRLVVTTCRHQPLRFFEADLVPSETSLETAGHGHA